MRIVCPPLPSHQLPELQPVEAGLEPDHPRDLHHRHREPVALPEVGDLIQGDDAKAERRRVKLAPDEGFDVLAQATVGGDVEDHVQHPSPLVCIVPEDRGV